MAGAIESARTSVGDGGRLSPEIQPLPKDVVQLMAAGEVIDSPAAVVRELVENALDAGASRITVAVRSQPWHITVTDDGSGLTLNDLRRAAAAHSTSKLSDLRDLWRIQSLGFRGEALHSLSQLTRLTLCSRPQQDADGGYEVTYDRDGHPQSVTPLAMAPGTRVTVTDLFYCFPARQQAAPSVKQQTQAIQRTLQTLALCHSTVTWQAHLNDRTWMTLWPGASALHVLPQVMRRVQVTDLREHQQTVTLPESKPARLYLLMGLPDRCHRPRPDGVTLALNGRPVQLPDLEATVGQTLRRSLPRDRHPIAFLHLQAPPDQIDWHRSPDKSHIYLRHLEVWGEAIGVAIEAALRLGPVPELASAGPQRLTQLIALAEPQASYDAETNITESPQPLALKALAQVHDRYILAEHPAGLCLIEQHIAHERVLYEELCDRWQLVPLETPIVLSHLKPEQLTQLERIGLEVAPFGPDLWAVRNAPAPLAEREDCSEALWELSLGQDLDAALVATACRTAIRNGTPLTQTTMDRLLEAWQRTRKPQTCPHGRPICLTLNESSLARYFRRHWVIGKSHGI
ncbi:MAG: DNA mismatch repair endonuclease MutL [Leptolyngbyaceae cyanobacterium]